MKFRKHRRISYIHLHKFEEKFTNIIHHALTQYTLKVGMFSKNMIQNSLMDDIGRPSNSGNRCQENGSFIQCVNNREPQIHKLRCHGIDSICREVNPYAHIEIPDGTVGEFVTDYVSENSPTVPSGISLCT